jgi:hypothetical protein
MDRTGFDDGPSEAETPSLGDRLRAQEEERRRMGPEAARERESLSEAVYKANEEKLRTLFAKARANVEHAVAANHAVESVRMDDTNPYTFGYGTIVKLPNSPKHAYYHVFVDADAWARENGLELEFRYNHDGERESWYEVRYIPRRNV